jgi:ribose/xylose/arabinose/galactoside ABC-type transport system permease subunit
VTESAPTIRRHLRDTVGEYGILIAFVLLVVMFSILSPVFLSLGNIINIGSQSTLLLIASFAMTFVIISGEIDLSVNSLASLTGVIVAIMLRAEWSLPLAILAGLVSGAVSGFVCGFITVKGQIPSFIVTLGMFSALRGLTFILTNSSTIPNRDDTFIALFSDLTRPLGIPITIFYALGVFLILNFLLNRTVFGHHVYAVGGNAAATRLAGVNVDRVKILVFTLAGLVVGFAGILFTARLGAGSAEIPRNLELDAIAAVVLGGTSFQGGRGSLYRTVLGALLIATLNNGLTLLNAALYTQLIVKGAIIVAAVLLDRWARRTA